MNKRQLIDSAAAFYISLDWCAEVAVGQADSCGRSG